MLRLGDSEALLHIFMSDNGRVFYVLHIIGFYLHPVNVKMSLVLKIGIKNKRAKNKTFT